MSATPSPSVDIAPELLTRARGGDRDALDAVARWCLPRVYRWALVRTGESDEADDVTQDVLASLDARIATFDGRSQFGTWLYRVTANAASGRRRGAARRLALLAARPPESAPDEEARRLDALHGAHVTDLVRSLLVELPEQQRVVFDLADLQGLEAREIAAMLELEPVTIRSHLMRARRAMRSRILARMPTLAEDGA